jgi:hypothetical protein
MKRIGQAVTALALGAMLAAPAAKAQVKFGVEGSAAIPMGDLGDIAGTGFGVAGQVLFKPAAIPFGVRIDGSYNSFSLKDEVADGGFRTVGGALSALFQMSGIGPRPYLVVGPGVYNGNITGDVCDDTECEGKTKFAVRGGVGLALPLSGISTAIEASLTNIFTDEEEDGFDGVRFVNIGVAIRFGGSGS